MPKKRRRRKSRRRSVKIKVEIYGLYRRRKDELLESEGIMRVYVCECVCLCVLQFTDVLWFPPAFNEERKHGYGGEHLRGN